MVTLRVSKVTIQVDHKLRVAKVLAQGASTNPKLRVSHVVAQGGTPLTVRAIPDQTSEAFDTVTVTASGNFPAGTLFTWRQISGPPVAFSDNGSYITYPSPPAMGGAAVLFGVTATAGGQSSPEVTSTNNVAPHLYWQAVGSSWVPLTRKTAV